MVLVLLPVKYLIHQLIFEVIQRGKNLKGWHFNIHYLLESEINFVRQLDSPFEGTS